MKYLITTIKKIFNKQKVLLFFTFLLCIKLFIHAQENVIPPKSNKLVNDYVGILKPQEVEALENKLVAFNDSNSVQITVVIVADLHGYDKAEYATMIGNEWGVGQKGFDNGIVILIKPVGKQGERHVFIAVGYGLEAVIPDAVAKRIVENDILPYFKEGQYYTGIDKATNTLISLAKKEFTATQYMKNTQKSPWIALIPFLALIIVFLLIKLIKKTTMPTTISSKKIPFWITLLLISSMGRNKNSWNSFSGKGGGIGSSGFGGFGGGSFGGGGADGSW